MPGNDHSFNVDAYLHYIFDEENEPEQVGEQELHRPMQAPWLIGSDIGVTILGSTINILQRRSDEQFAIGYHLCALVLNKWFLTPFRDGIWNHRQVSVGDRGGPSHTT